MENGGLGNTITGSIGDACPPEDRCFRDIASFHKNNYAICSFLKKSRGRYKYRKKLNKSYNLIKPAILLKQQSSHRHSSPIRPTTVSPSPPLSTPAHECRESKQIIFKRALIWNEWSVLTLLIFTIIQIIPSTFFFTASKFHKNPAKWAPTEMLCSAAGTTTLDRERCSTRVGETTQSVCSKGSNSEHNTPATHLDLKWQIRKLSTYQCKPRLQMTQKGKSNTNNNKNHPIANPQTERTDNNSCPVCKPQFSRKDATMRHHSTHLQLSVPALLLQTKHESYARNYVPCFITIYYYYFFFNITDFI